MIKKFICSIFLSTFLLLDPNRFSIIIHCFHHSFRCKWWSNQTNIFFTILEAKKFYYLYYMIKHTSIFYVNIDMRGNKQWMKKNNWPMSHLMNLNLDFDNNNKKIKNDCVGDSGKTYIYIRHVLLKTRAMDVILWYLLFKMTNWKPLRIFFWCLLQKNLQTNTLHYFGYTNIVLNLDWIHWPLVNQNDQMYHYYTRQYIQNDVNGRTIMNKHSMKIRTKEGEIFFKFKTTHIYSTLFNSI